MQHDVRDLGQHAALRGHEPDLPELHAQLTVAALQVKRLPGDLLAGRAPQLGLLPVQLELEKLGAPGAHLQRGDHALLHVFRLEELSEDALVAARVLRELGGELVLDLEEEALCGLVGLQAHGDAHGLGVAVAGRVPQHLQPFALPGRRVAALSAQRQVLSSLGVGLDVSELHRHG